jgi:hypothetical protein
MNTFTTSFINQLYDDIQKEKTAILLEIKNDKELKNITANNQKLNLLDSLTKNILKYRNITLKESLKNTI